MPVQQFSFEIATEGNGQVVDLTPELTRRLRALRDPSAGDGPLRGPGVLLAFVAGSTAALTTIEYEVGLIKHDLPALLQRLIPDDARYEHEATWHDDNGHAHLRASLIGPSLSVPIADGKLLTSTYQQVVLIDFDTRPRKRTVIATVTT